MKLSKRDLEVLNGKPRWYVPELTISASLWKQVKRDYRAYVNKKLDKKHPNYIHTITSSEEITKAASYLLDNHTQYGVVMFSKLKTKCGFNIPYALQFISEETYDKLDLYRWNQKMDNELKHALKTTLNKK
ncbi:MAG: hypothetical protein ACOVOQ_05765 [Flavobacterium sp.]